MPDGYADEARDALLAKAARRGRTIPPWTGRFWATGAVATAFPATCALTTSASPPRTWPRRRGWPRWPKRTPGSACAGRRAGPWSRSASPADARLNPVSRSGLVVDIVTDDMPYLVDSVTTELNRHEAEIQLLVHPLLRVRRDVTGALRGILGVCGDIDQDQPGGGELTESWIHVELGPPRDKVTADQLAADLRHVLDDVRVAVEDQPRMSAVARRLADDLGGEPGSDEAEHGDLLRWLADGNFTFLGYREYDFVRTEEGTGLRAVPGTGLGILRHARQGREAVRKMSTQVVRRAQDPAERLVLAKANSRSTVYRANYLDYVSVKRLGPDGVVTGEFRFLGLYSHAAHIAPISRHSRAPAQAGPGPGGGRAASRQPRRAGPGRDTRGLPARGALRDLGGRAHPDRARRAAAERAQADPAVHAPGPVRAVHVLPGVPAAGPVHHPGQAARAGHLAGGAARGLGGLQRHRRRLGPGPPVRGGQGGAGPVRAAGGRGRPGAEAGRGGQVVGRGPRRRGDPGARRGAGQHAGRPAGREHPRDVQGGRHRRGRRRRPSHDARAARVGEGIRGAAGGAPGAVDAGGVPVGHADHAVRRAAPAAAHGARGRRRASVPVPRELERRLVLDLRVRPAAAGRRRFRRPAPALRGRADRAVARPDRGRRVQRAGADGGPDLARGDPAARLREVPAPGRDAVQRGLRAAGAAVQRGDHPAADPAVRVQVRPGPGRAASASAARPSPRRSAASSTR